MSLIKQILKIKRQKYALFTTPSHNQKVPYKTLLGNKYYAHDFSEIDGLDNLNAPEECILELCEKFRDIYYSKMSQPLTNGSTQGILVLMLAVLGTGEKAVVAENCHKAVHSGLILTGASPVWVKPNFESDFGVYTSVSAEKIEEALKTSGAKCVIITTPAYDGEISDTAKISAICKEYGAILIVDEAHGALWNFDKTLGTPAILAGADASVQSLHKTCGAVNPAAILHLAHDSKIPQSRVMDALNLISTTSPSYPAIINIEETVTFLNSKKGRKTLDKMVFEVTETRNKIKQFENLELYQNNCDITKILVRPLKISAEEASEILYSKFKIECEIQHARALTFLCGLGTTKQKLAKLLKGLKYIDKISKNRENIVFAEIFLPEREQVISPQSAFNTIYEEVLPEEATGRISAQLITAYPPGIPILTFGEIIKDEHIEFLNPNIKIRIVK